MKKLVSIVLCAFMLCMLLPAGILTAGAATGGRSRADAVAWANNQVGKSLDYDGQYGMQCVDLTCCYYVYLGQAAPLGNANAYGNGGKFTPAGWTYQNNPQPGDVAVDTIYGHVGIVVEVNGDTMVCVEQNYNHHDYCERITRRVSARQYNKFIRPDFASVPSTYTLDVNGLLDGSNSGNLGNYGTFDVYINGSLVANDVNDYYASHAAGSSYRITDIKLKDGKFLNGLASGSDAASGKLDNNRNVRLEFQTVDKAAFVKNYQPAKIDVYNGHTYWFYNVPVTWWGADVMSRHLGGHLVTISNAAENSFVFSMAGQAATWIGATDKDSEGVWKWVTGEVVSYKNWTSGEPNNYTDCLQGYENYAHLSAGTGTWNDNEGCFRAPFVVEFDYAYTVSYRLNDSAASGAPAAQTKPVGKAITISSTEPKLAGHTFRGWSTSPNGGVEYRPGDTYSADRNAVLYPVWVDGVASEWSTTKPAGVDESRIETKKQYRFSDKETKKSDSSYLSGYTLTESKWIKTGSGSIEYVNGWPSGFNTSHSLYAHFNKSAKTGKETANSKTEVSSAHIGWVYWHWCLNSYAHGPVNRTVCDYYERPHVGFHAFFSESDASHSDGSVWCDPVWCFRNRDACSDTYWWFRTPVYRQNYTEYKKEYTHEKWSSWSDWSDTVYTASSNRRVEVRTMYRAFIPAAKTYTVSFNSNGGGGAPGAQTKTENKTLTLSGVKPTRGGYTFLGWAETSGATAAKYAAGGSFTKNADTVLYAVWKENVKTYTVSFNSNGGGGTMANVTAKAGEKLTLPECGFAAPKGKVFSKWSVGKPGDKVDITSDCIITAVWTDAGEIKVDFIPGDVNGNGRIDSNDYALAKRAFLGTYELDSDELMRADIDGSGKLDPNEYAMIKRHCLGTYTIPGAEGK